MPGESDVADDSPVSYGGSGYAAATLLVADVGDDGDDVCDGCVYFSVGKG